MKKGTMVFKFDGTIEKEEALKKYKRAVEVFSKYYNVLIVPKEWKVTNLKEYSIHIEMSPLTDKKLAREIFNLNKKNIDETCYLFGNTLSLEVIESANTIE